MDQKIVYTNGAWQVLRTEFFTRCSNGACWEVLFDGKFYANVMRKKDGIKMINDAIANSPPA
jgi:hypothetical protein